MKTAITSVQEALNTQSQEDSQFLGSQVAGLDVALLDMGRAIHMGAKRSQAAAKSTKKRSLSDSGPIELGDGQAEI